MKSNEQKSPVDEYFRQHEADIPVSFDPEHWRQLAAALDAAQPPEPLQPVKTSPRRHSGKGWWVSGVFLLALTAVWWGWRFQNTAPAVAAPSPDSIGVHSRFETPAPAHSVGPTLPAPGKTDGPAPENRAQPVKKISGEAAGPPVQDVSAAPAVSPENAAPAAAPLATPAAAADSLNAPQPAKKKKHLFW